MPDRWRFWISDPHSMRDLPAGGDMPPPDTTLQVDDVEHDEKG
jgi:hypothetical protein